MLLLDHVWKIYRVGTFGGGRLLAVRDVSFAIGRGEIVSLIGESGSGKSTIGRLILRLTSTSRGRILIDEVDLASLRGRAAKDYYRRVQGVFQDPFSSYNPIFKVDHLFDLVRIAFFGGVARSEWEGRVATALRSVGLEAGQVLRKYPHQLSGGQLQRLLLARALLLESEYLVADEVISMLDACTRIDVLNLLGDLRARGLGVLFITHDLSLGHYISDRTIILRRGRIVEMGRTELVFADPRHPYTRQLLLAVPQLRRRWAEVEAELAARWSSDELGCPVHGRHRPLEGPPTSGETMLVEVAPDHLVGCTADGERVDASAAA
jgi:oligopeptide/dipeptide ABC transporter ATP-binding protein